jgi:hypothetical protein
MVLRSTAVALLAVCASGCVNVSCRPDFVINTWTPPGGSPAADGQSTVRQKLAEVESISFITCDYDDYKEQ